MVEEQVVDGSATQWRNAPRPYQVVDGMPRLGPAGSTVMRAKMYLPGADGGAVAVLASFPDGTGPAAHVHTRAQFQLTVAGAMQTPTGRIDAVAVQYSHHCYPYEPFVAHQGHLYYELNARRAGQLFVEHAQNDPRGKGRVVNARGKYLCRQAGGVPWEDVPGGNGLRQKVLIPESEGPWAAIVECPPDAEVPAPAPLYGQFQIVLAGAVSLDGQTLGPESLRFTRGREVARPLRASPEGATVAVLSYDADADWEPPREVVAIELPA